MQMKLRRQRRSSGHRRMRRGMGAVMALGAIGAAEGGLRRWRHRHEDTR